MRYRVTTKLLWLAALILACGPARPKAVPLAADPGTLTLLAGA
jgi:hypothetical protein